MELNMIPFGVARLSQSNKLSDKFGALASPSNVSKFYAVANEQFLITLDPNFIMGELVESLNSFHSKGYVPVGREESSDTIY